MASPRPKGAASPVYEQHREQRRQIERARDHLVRAAAILTEWPIQKDALPLALMETVLGLMSVVRADLDNAANKRVLALLERYRTEEAE